MGISLLTMGQGNIIALGETLKSFSKLCDEVIYGDLLIFPEDREVLHIYEKEYNLKVVKYPFNYIFKNGFSSILNDLASHATNDIVMYMNTSEVIDEDYGAAEAIKNNPDCNAFYFTHRTDPHRWYRNYNRHELKWSGVIHEQLEGDYRPFHKPVFMMADLPKDMYSDFKAKVFDSVKCIVYFNNYMKIVDDPNALGATDPGWIKFATDDYSSFKERLEAKGDQYKAFIKGDYELLMSSIYSKQDFVSEKLISSSKIEYQADPVYLGKTPDGIKIKHFRDKVIRYKNHPEFWDTLEGWEAETFDVLDRFLGPNKAFLDIGAWNGVLSVYAHLIGATPYAVEPDSVAFADLEEMFELNDISYSNAAYVAITDKAGSALLLNSPDGFGNSMSSVIEREGKDVGERVNTMTLEQIVDFWDIKPDLIKIDTEGAESLIIPSSIELLKKLNTPLLISLHPYWVDLKPVFESLSKVYTRCEALIHDAYLLLP